MPLIRSEYTFWSNVDRIATEILLWTEQKWKDFIHDTNIKLYLFKDSIKYYKYPSRAYYYHSSPAQGFSGDGDFSSDGYLCLAFRNTRYQINKLKRESNFHKPQVTFPAMPVKEEGQSAKIIDTVSYSRYP